jgi:hypothetical protein
MALISPGVQVTITNESFFIPDNAVTVPLVIIATSDEKKQFDGVTDAEGTFESNVVRTITSRKQAADLYGIPVYKEDVAGNQHHGDARNEYGLTALHRFLGVADRAYVLRANVNLDDDIINVRKLWDRKVTQTAQLFDALAQTYINEYNVSNNYVAGQGGVGFQTANFANNIAPGAIVSVHTNGQYWADTTLGLLFKWDFASHTWTGFLPTETTFAAAAPVGITAGHLWFDASNPTIVKQYDGAQWITVTTTAISSTKAPGTYELSLDIDGAGAQTIDVPMGVTTPASLNPVVTAHAETYDEFVIRLSGLMTGATASIVAGNIKIASDTPSTGAGTSTILVTTLAAFDMFGILPGFQGLLAAVDGNVAQYKVSLTAQEVKSLVDTATDDLWKSFSFKTLENNFMDDKGVNPLQVYAAGFGSAATGNFNGFDGDVALFVLNTAGSSTINTEFTPQEAEALFINSADDFKYTQEFAQGISLGANDAAKRVSIVTALQAVINSNQGIRSETVEYNLIICPGYPEVADELLALRTDIEEEAFVISCTPNTLTPEQTVTWLQTQARRQNVGIAYYYPGGLHSNLDGKDIYVDGDSTALRVYTINDKVAALWFAPYGVRRGIVDDLSRVGYISGTLGGPTTFNELELSRGQRDDLYRYFVNCNTVSFIPGRGILVMGQKTSAPAASARDRVNVERLLGYIRRQLRKHSFAFLAEPNDALTRKNFKATVDSFLANLVVRRGLYDFATLCDESNNTGDRIDKNELWIDVAIKPVKAVDFIYIPIRVLKTAASFN